jgi:hypothetical protein
LTSENGSVAFELLLIMPLVLLVAAFVLEAERALRSAWVAQSAARTAAWLDQRSGRTPHEVRMTELLQAIEPRLRGVQVSSSTLDGGDALERVLGGVLAMLSSPAGSKMKSRDLTGVEVTIKADVGATWGAATRRAVLSGRTGSAADVQISNDDFRGAALTAAIGALVPF